MLHTMGVEVKLPKVRKSRIRKLRSSLATDIEEKNDLEHGHFADVSSLEAKLPAEDTWIQSGFLKKCVFAQEKSWQVFDTTTSGSTVGEVTNMDLVMGRIGELFFARTFCSWKGSVTGG